MERSEDAPEDPRIGSIIFDNVPANKEANNDKSNSDVGVSNLSAGSKE